MAESSPSKSQANGHVLQMDVDDADPIIEPIQKKKTLIAGLLLAMAWIANDVSLAWIHEKVPRGVAGAPLPDLFFTYFPEVRWTIKVTEILLFIMATSALAMAFFHQHRWIVLRRTFFIAALCYFARAFCITVLQVPVPSVHTYCAPKAKNTSAGLVFYRVVGVLSGMGMDLYRGRVLCGDLIVSGHTIVLILAWLLVRQYSPRKFASLAYVYGLGAAVAIISILFSRKHYTIDTVLAYYLTTRVFWIYHTLAANVSNSPPASPAATSRSPSFNTPRSTYRYPSPAVYSVWWASLLEYFEADAPPDALWINRFNWPSGCPRYLRQRAMRNI